MSDTGALCVHREFKTENKILTSFYKAQNSLVLVSLKIFLFYIILRPRKALLLQSSSCKSDGSRKIG